MFGFFFLFFFVGICLLCFFSVCVGVPPGGLDWWFQLVVAVSGCFSFFLGSFRRSCQQAANACCKSQAFTGACFRLLLSVACSCWFVPPGFLKFPRFITTGSPVVWWCSGGKPHLPSTRSRGSSPNPNHQSKPIKGSPETRLTNCPQVSQEYKPKQSVQEATSSQGVPMGICEHWLPHKMPVLVLGFPLHPTAPRRKHNTWSTATLFASLGSAHCPPCHRHETSDVL